MEKTSVSIGTQGYLRQFTGSYYVDMVKEPVTVIAVSNREVVVQHARLIAPVYHCCGNPNLDRPDLEGKRVFFYDTVAETILPDPNGKIERLTWHPKKGRWGTSGTSYPYFLITEAGYQHQPYLD
jgi:hypothetical protein